VEKLVKSEELSAGEIAAANLIHDAALHFGGFV
jgi:hypothetical protein